LSKQEQILSTALRLFVADGFHGTPTSKIANEADVANGTLFHYYKTKEHLIIALYNRIKAELANDIEVITKEDAFITIKLRKIFEHSVYWSRNNPDKFYYIQQFNFSPHLAKVSQELLQQQTGAFTQFIIGGIAKKLLRQQPVELIAAMFNGQVYGICQYLKSSEATPEDQKKIIDDAYEMVWLMLKYM
jgi:AcrR family transcriptional regulator